MMFILSNHVVILISYYIWLVLKFQINLIIKLYKSRYGYRKTGFLKRERDV
ncbi:hypothetical protein ACUXCV_002053 [Staphylococcus warneri]